MHTKPMPRTQARPQHPNSWVFHDGEFVRYHDVRIGPMTHALHYGTGCFTGFRAFWNDAQQRLLLLQPHAHYRRLHRSARILTLELPYDVDGLVEVTVELLRRNEYRGDAYVRPLVFKSGEMLDPKLAGVPDSLLIYTTPMPSLVRPGGLRCVVSSWQRLPDTAMPARAKATGAYLNSALARTEALQRGADEAILLTADGHVSEGPTANIFVVRDDVVITPPVTDDILEGITRGLVIELLREDMGREVVERSVDRSELYSCDEVFLCGTGTGVAAVTEVDGRPVGEGEPGPLEAELERRYSAAVRGEDPARLGWLVPV